MAMASVVSPGPATPQLTMTSKEWVIPPRPKPGRKPATDTPPTKRKAQNRAAQRAFRERRAARVGELEELLEERAAEHEKKEQEFQERIRQLEVESQALRAKCVWLENTLEKERQERARMGSSISSTPMDQRRRDFADISSNQHPQDIDRRNMSRSGSIVGPRPIAQPFSISQIVSPLGQMDDTTGLTCGSCEPNGRCACVEEVIAEATLSCGKCAPGTNCACLDDAVQKATSAPDLKRPHPPASPSVLPGDKRHRLAEPDSPMETDFTAMFSRKKPDRPESPPPQPQPRILRAAVTIEPKDQCGFCNDGSYCVCADSMAPATADAVEAAQSLPTPQPVSHQTQTPPPENDAGPAPVEITSTGAIRLPSLKSLSRNSRPTAASRLPPARGSTCGPGGPGTCAQCLADPKSGLFCRSLAANLDRSLRPSWSQSKSAGGCCGGNGGSGGCCKQDNSDGPTKLPAVRTITGDRKAGQRTRLPSSAELGLSLSCADAYKTLSSHRHFGEAADDIGDWLPRLRAAPAPPPSRGQADRSGGGGKAPGLAPIEVEAASIMSVLKGFDVRFGS